MAQDAKGHIIIFEHSQFRGKHRHIFNEEPDLNHKEDRSMSDNISSFIVLKGTWKLYRNDNYSGAYDREFGKGMYKRMRDFDVENDEVSSLRVVPDRT